MDIKGPVEEVTEQTEKHIIGNWKQEGRESLLNSDRKLSKIMTCNLVKSRIC